MKSRRKYARRRFAPQPTEVDIGGKPSYREQGQQGGRIVRNKESAPLPNRVSNRRLPAGR